MGSGQLRRQQTGIRSESRAGWQRSDPEMFAHRCPEDSFRHLAFRDYHIPGRILMFFEGQHTVREIWMDGRKLPDDPDPRWYGYSVGRWEGDTLVVETAGFNDKTWLGAQGQPHSDEMRTIERYRRVDHDTIQFNLTIDDPKTYTKTWEAEPR